MSAFDASVRILMTVMSLTSGLVALFRPRLVLRTFYGSRKVSMNLYAVRGLQIAAGLTVLGIIYTILIRSIR